MLNKIKFYLTVAAGSNLSELRKWEIKFSHKFSVQTKINKNKLKVNTILFKLNINLILNLIKIR